MPFTLHTHSGQFCYHAAGTLEEMVQAGVQARLASMGLSEHMPRYRDIDLYPEEQEAHATPQLLVERFDAYVQEARRLRVCYRDRIALLIGMETEYIYDEQASEVNALRQRYDLDYIIGSVHHVHGHPIDFNAAMLAQAQAASGEEGTVDELVLDYFVAQYRMLQALKPEVVGHFDLIRRLMPITTSWSSAVWEQLRQNAQYIASYGGLVEINTAAWKYGLADPYPQANVVRVLQEAGCRFTLSDDAHRPSEVGTFHHTRLRDYLDRCGIVTIYGLE
ncbi:putative histidinol-phosphatase, partial [Syncephalis pseudoplumigaleata]